MRALIIWLVTLDNKEGGAAIVTSITDVCAMFQFLLLAVVVRDIKGIFELPLILLIAKNYIFQEPSRSLKNQKFF